MKKHDYDWRAPSSWGGLSPSKGWGRLNERGFGGGLNQWRHVPQPSKGKISE